MKATFWGTRGSIAAPGAGTVRFGGNTSCVQLVTDAGTLIVLDCGTGARNLGDHLIAMLPTGIHGHIFFTHTHWDHIQGFPFFAPVFATGNDWTVYGPTDGEHQLEQTLSGQMQYTYFPVELEQISAGIAFLDLSEGRFTLADTEVQSQYLNHPAVTLGYRLTSGSASVVYCTDHEPFSPVLFSQSAESHSIDAIVHTGDRRHANFLKGADLVIHDAQYTADEYRQKRNWGHSPVEYVVEICVAAGVDQLALYHHDPSHDDAALEEIEANARRMVAGLGGTMRVFCAREGETIALSEGTPATLDGARPKGSPPCVLVADDEPLIRELVRDILSLDRLTIEHAASGEEVLTKVAAQLPDLILLDMRLPGMDGFEVLTRIRSMGNARDLPIIMLTAVTDAEYIQRGFTLGATDYMTKPFSPAYLRARVGGWLRRSASESADARA